MFDLIKNCLPLRGGENEKKDNMGLFSKCKNTAEPDNTGEGRNEIGNKEMKELLGNTALSVLHEQGNTGGDTKVEFGYLFSFDGHGIESLFKLTNDKGIFYFAAQKDQLILLDFDEGTYNAYRQSFFSN